MSGSFRVAGLEGLAAFLAGAGLGAVLARRLPDAGWGLAGNVRGSLSGTVRTAPVAASLGRLQALLGEIRGLLGPQAGGPEAAGKTLDPAGDRSATDGPAGGDAWRTPDRIGYGDGGDAPDAAGHPFVLALGAAALGVAAAYAGIRKGGAAAAWPALAGFLAAGSWAAWGGRAAGGEGRQRTPGRLPGRGRGRDRDGSRSGRATTP